MSERPSVENEFLDQITSVVEKNISNEQFGVSELASEMNMSRSNLLRRVKKVTGLSVSQHISQIRLKRGMTLLRTSSLNVSEVSHQVGFNSTSYFIKCFREYYGYPPGEAGKRTEEEVAAAPVVHQPNRNRKLIILSAIVVIVTGFGALYYFGVPSSRKSKIEKSIAVLPFKNESNDSTNLYLINGLMESTLTNLQQIKDIKVISRTSTEKYRSSSKSIPEMAKELGVNYFVEGSGQKIGDKILLNIQLIDASSDKHLWARQYRREVKDIFELQQEVAKNIAQEIEAVITPEEEKRIEQIPTRNLVAYDLFLKGRDIFYHGDRVDLKNSVPYFKKAIEEDNEFAMAYAEIAIVYYYLDIFQADKQYSEEISNYANKAISLDPRLTESLVAKALSHLHRKEYESAVKYFEKALEFNPNSGLVFHFLMELYNIQVPNTGKYLEYALKKVRVDIGSDDSTTASFNYLQLSNAFLQTGFLDEAKKYIDKSLAYNPKNPFGYIKAFILYTKSRDLKQTKDLLLFELKKDTSRFDIMQQVGNMYYSMNNYDSAYYYFKKSIGIRDALKLDLFRNEEFRLAVTFAKLGQPKEAARYAARFKEYAEGDRSIYKEFHLAIYYSSQGDTINAIQHLKRFPKEDNFQFWVLLLDEEPAADAIKNTPEFKKVMAELKTKFWKAHDELKKSLEEEGLL